MPAEPVSAPVRSTALRRDSEGAVRHGSEWLQLWADPDSIRSAEARAMALQQARRTARTEHALAAGLRAMAADARHPMPVEVRFHGGDAELDGARAHLPEVSGAGLAVVRGAADRLAARLRYHAAALGRALEPPQPERRPLFAALEQARCETLAARHRPGVPDNLRAYSEWHLARGGFAHARLAADLPLEEAMAVVLRGVLAEAPLALDGTALEVWDRWVRGRLAAEAAALRATLTDQTAYAAAAQAFIAALFRSVGRVETPPLPSPAAPHEPAEGAEDGRVSPRVAAMPDTAEETQASAEPAPPPRAPSPQPAPARYTAFTTAHDRVLAPSDLCGEAELAALRARLDAETGSVRGLLTRLANQLQRRLLAQQRRDWEFDREDGLLDAARLDRVVTTPSASLAFKQEREASFRDTVVTLLIDCSGSMRGRAILLAAIAADVTARALERCGVACEVLGFTTADFSGGRSAADWARARRPRDPGRLGDLWHIVVKPADSAWRAARTGFGVLLRPDLLHENVDGEALLWACRRLLARRERRRVLVVISDGAPSEAATERANPPGLLQRHLASVIADIEAARSVELRAIGIRHDVGHHYPRAVTIPDAQMVGPALIAQLAQVFETRQRGRLHARQS